MQKIKNNKIKTTNLKYKFKKVITRIKIDFNFF